MDTQLPPPGPKRSPFLSRQLWAYWKNPLDFLSNLANKYGDLALFKVGPQRICLVNNPVYIENILEGDQACFANESPVPASGMEYLSPAWLTCQDVGGFQEINRFGLGLDEHRLAGFGSTTVTTAFRVSDGWENLQSIDIRKEMKRLVFRIVVETFSGVCEDERLDQLEELATQLRPDPSAMEYPLIGRLRRLRFSKSNDEMRGKTELQRTIFPCLAVCEPMVDLLAWTWRLVGEYPEAQASLHAELDGLLMGHAPTLAYLESLVYTRMVVAEVLRLYPPVRLIRRQVIRDFSLDGYLIPASSALLISPWVMQRDPRYYPEVGRFDPQRWTPAAVVGRPRYTFLPFGGGAYACPGEDLVWKMATLVLATLAQRWQFHLMPGQAKNLKTKAGQWPKNGVSMWIEKCKPNRNRL
jgi:cytochrome P450